MSKNGPEFDPLVESRSYPARLWSWRKTVVLVLLILAFLATLTFFRKDLTLTRLAENEIWLRQLGREHPVSAYALAFVLYVAVTGLSIPGSSVLSLLYGWYFRFWGAFILVSFAATTGATVAFLLSRYLFRDLFQQRFGDRLARFNLALQREGAFYLFALRLTPVVPFFVINSVMGLTRMRTRTFWWVSQLGMLPGTVVYVYAGATAPSLAVLANEGVRGLPLAQLFIAFCLLGCFPLLARAIVNRFHKRLWSGRR